MADQFVSIPATEQGIQAMRQKYAQAITAWEEKLAVLDLLKNHLQETRLFAGMPGAVEEWATGWLEEEIREKKAEIGDSIHSLIWHIRAIDQAAEIQRSPHYEVSYRPDNTQQSSYVYLSTLEVDHFGGVWEALRDRMEWRDSVDVEVRWSDKPDFTRDGKPYRTSPVARLIAFLEEQWGALSALTKVEVDLDQQSGGYQGTPHAEATCVRVYVDIACVRTFDSEGCDLQEFGLDWPMDSVQPPLPAMYAYSREELLQAKTT